MTESWKRRTLPRWKSAPLPPDAPLMTGRNELTAEIARAGAELLWALHRQREAWAKMQQLKREYDKQPNSYYIDNERPWKLAVGDVQWWRGEVSSRANALSALLAWRANV